LFFAQKDLNKISVNDIAKWRDFRMKTITGGSFKRELTILRLKKIKNYPKS